MTEKLIKKGKDVFNYIVKGTKLFIKNPTTIKDKVYEKYDMVKATIPDSYKETALNLIDKIKKEAILQLHYDWKTLKAQKWKLWRLKIILGIVGLLFFDFWGLIIGLIIGHFADISLYPQNFLIFELDNDEKPLQRAMLSKQIPMRAFARAMLGLLAKTAVADGSLNKKETEALSDLLALDEADFAIARDIFLNQTKSKTSAREYADELIFIFGNSSPLFTMVIDKMLEMAETDDIVNKQEYALIKEVAKELKINEIIFDAIAVKYKIKGVNIPTFGSDKNNDFEILGLTPRATKEEVHKAWIRLVRDNHPDKLVAKGLEPSQIEEANEKIAIVNASYERIMKGFEAENK